MSTPDTCFAVMFADVSGSTRLYEKLGDYTAKAVIDDCLERMIEATHLHGGTIVKTIGDEIMSRFDTADAGIQAACSIQEMMERRPADHGMRVSVRIGVHYGPAILEGGDVFGDAVNVAARMAGIAKARQVITTEETVSCLSPHLATRTRLFDRVAVKGKQVETVVFEMVWEAPTDVTCVMTRLPAAVDAGTQADTLQVRCGAEEKQLRGDGSVFVLGRGDNCDLVVPSALTSRQHARIEYRRGKFILVDQSTNGTWVRLQDGSDVYLRREELPLWGEGVISLGEAIRDNDPALVHFRKSP